jgi:hypothetical protein
MELHFAFLASAAEVNRDQRISALGIGIHGMLVPHLPVVIPSLVLVLQIRFDLEDCGVPYAVRVTAENPDGTPVGIDTRTDVTPELPPHFPEHGSASDSMFTFFNIPFAQEGIHHIHIEVNDRVIKTLGLAIVVNRPPANGG